MLRAVLFGKDVQSHRSAVASIQASFDHFPVRLYTTQELIAKML
jgi:hypothetical protein